MCIMSVFYSLVKCYLSLIIYGFLSSLRDFICAFSVLCVGLVRQELITVLEQGRDLIRT